jgi:hypothetical protein
MLVHCGELMKKAELWHFYYHPEDAYAYVEKVVREAFCPGCQEYHVGHVKEYTEDRLVLREPEDGEKCDGCGVSAIEVDEE